MLENGEATFDSSPRTSVSLPWWDFWTTKYDKSDSIGMFILKKHVQTNWFMRAHGGKRFSKQVIDEFVDLDANLSVTISV